MATDEQKTNTPATGEQQPKEENSAQPPQKIGLVWIFLGIGGILLMWLISSKVF